MSEQQSEPQHYRVSVHELAEEPGTLVFTFVPKGLQQGRANGEPFKRLPQYILTVRREEQGGLTWNATSDDPGTARADLEGVAVKRVAARAEWVERVTRLVAQVEQWGRELGWATRRIDKKLDDSWIGRHTLPALQLQEGTCRLLLEPVGRSAPGIEGVVDLYQMPAYDDIASLYFHSGGWHVQQPRAGREVAGDALSKESLQRVLDALRSHAA